MARSVVALVFRCRPLTERPRATAEAWSVRWAHPDEVTSLMTPAYAVRVTDALNGAAATTRTHDGVHLIEA
jgi:8-oxo-dGTP diphosphatase